MTIRKRASFFLLGIMISLQGVRAQDYTFDWLMTAGGNQSELYSFLKNF